LGHDCRAAYLAHNKHVDLEIPAVIGHAQQISHPDLARGLGNLSVALNPAQLTRPRGQGSRLEKPGGPKPFVHSHRGHDLFSASLGKTFNTQEMGKPRTIAIANIAVIAKDCQDCLFPSCQSRRSLGNQWQFWQFLVVP
jgi:hypothetical protein